MLRRLRSLKIRASRHKMRAASEVRSSPTRASASTELRGIKPFSINTLALCLHLKGSGFESTNDLIISTIMLYRLSVSTQALNANYKFRIRLAWHGK